MTRESSRFANSIRPGVYARLYKMFYSLFERVGGINIVDSHNMLPPGKKLVTANHDRALDPWLMGVVNPESLFSLGKEELGSWKYAFIGKWALEPLMNTKLIKRTGQDYDILEGVAEFMMEQNAAIQSFLYGTRNLEQKNVKAKTGVAHIAIRSSTEDAPTPVVPYGHSTSVWSPGKPIQVVVGKPVYAPPSGRSLTGAALRRERRDITEKLDSSIRSLAARAIALDTEVIGIPGEIRWNG